MPSPKTRREPGASRRTASRKKGGRATLKDALPEALRHAVDTYRAVAFGPAPDDAKAFQQHQAACKAGLAHIEALLKLADATGAEMPSKSDDGVDETSVMLARAEAAFAAYADQSPKEEVDATDDD